MNKKLFLKITSLIIIISFILSCDRTLAAPRSLIAEVKVSCPANKSNKIWSFNSSKLILFPSSFLAFNNIPKALMVEFLVVVY